MTRYWQTDPMKRKAFLRLRKRYARCGKRFIYLDESGFAASSHRTHGYALKGQRIYGYISAQTRPRTSLLAARNEEKMMTTWLFEGNCNVDVFIAKPIPHRKLTRCVYG